jgi:peptidase E
MRRWIVAIGGGEFMMEDGDSPLDAFVLELARARGTGGLPRLCWIGTAGGDSFDYWLRCQAAFAGRAEVSRLTLFERTVEDIDAFLLAHDLIYVGGGNTASLLAVWRAHGVDRALAGAHDAGIVLTGVSAGAICWFVAGTTDSYGPRLQALTGGLGFVSASLCPHYDDEPERRPTFQRLVGDGTLPAGYAVDDEAAVVFDGDVFVEAVATRPGPTAYRVAPINGGVAETALPTRVLP